MDSEYYSNILLLVGPIQVIASFTLLLTEKLGFDPIIKLLISPTYAP